MVRTSDFEGHTLGAYIPLDSLVPETDPRWEFMRPRKFRVKSIKLRGLLSQGLMIPAAPDWVEGRDVAELLGIKKWEPAPPPYWQGPKEPQDPNFQKYTDIENYRRYPNILVPGEPAVYTEKIHGSNGRFGYIRQPDNTLAWKIGSHRTVKPQEDNNIWGKVALRYRVQEKVDQLWRTIPGNEDREIILFGEVYGRRIQDLDYGAEDPSLVLFDILIDTRFLDWEDFENLSSYLGLPTVPTLYSGPFSPEAVDKHVEGLTILGNGKHIREGLVIRPVQERFHPEIGRVALKALNADYLLRKDGTEHH